jgi:hypothetical protein
MTTKKNNVTPAAAKAAIARFGIKISVIAQQLEIQRFEVYAFLDPAKYPRIRLSPEKRQRLEAWFRRMAA